MVSVGMTGIQSHLSLIDLNTIATLRVLPLFLICPFKPYILCSYIAA